MSYQLTSHVRVFYICICTMCVREASSKYVIHIHRTPPPPISRWRPKEYCHTHFWLQVSFWPMCSFLCMGLPSRLHYSIYRFPVRKCIPHIYIFNMGVFVWYTSLSSICHRYPSKVYFGESPTYICNSLFTCLAVSVWSIHRGFPYLYPCLIPTVWQMPLSDIHHTVHRLLLCKTNGSNLYRKTGSKLDIKPKGPSS